MDDQRTVVALLKQQGYEHEQAEKMARWLCNGPQESAGERTASVGVTVLPRAEPPSQQISERRGELEHKVPEAVFVPPSDSVVRAWCQSNGVPVSAKGRVGALSKAAYLAANNGGEHERGTQVSGGSQRTTGKTVAKGSRKRTQAG